MLVAELSGIPYLEIQFDKRGEPIHGSQAADAVRMLDARGTTDLIVVSHGWNNDMDEARSHYKRFASEMRPMVTRHLGDREPAILGVLWPSKKFADTQLIPGGVAATQSRDQAALTVQLETLRGAFTAGGADARLEEAMKLVPRLASPRVQAEFLSLVQAAAEQPEEDDDDEEGADRLFRLSAEELFLNLKRPITPRRRSTPGAGGVAATGRAASTMGDLRSGVFAAAQRLLNFTTYYQMRERAGLVGRSGLHPLLARLRRERPGVRLHLVGHSFGARLVTAAAGAAKSPTDSTATTLTLLQGAFSHHAFARAYEPGRDGSFRHVVSPGRVMGPIVISHTDNDVAVGINYAIVSRLAGQQAAGLGDARDRYGGIGRNGAVKTPEADFGTLGPSQETYRFEGGTVYNLRADEFISGHGDVHNPEVANAIAQVIRATG